MTLADAVELRLGLTARMKEPGLQRHWPRLHNLRADSRATIVARAGWQWTTVEGSAQLIGPDDPTHRL